MKNRIAHPLRMSISSWQTLKLYIFSIVAVILVFSMCGCIDNHEMTEEEQQSAATNIRAYYNELPELMEGYVKEISLNELSECNPEYILFTLYVPEEYHYGMYQCYRLDLKDDVHFNLLYGVFKDEKLADHAFLYNSPKFPCDTPEELLTELKNHTPLFEDDLWIDEVLDDFYPVGTDIRAEWMLLYDEMVQEIEKKGMPARNRDGASSLYALYKTVLVTENGNYNLAFLVTYSEELSWWNYSYSVSLEPVKQE